MKVKFLIFMMAMAMFSTGLTGCNLDGDNNKQQENLNYEPTRYNNDNRERPGNDVNENLRDPNDFEDLQKENKHMDEEEPNPDEEPSEERRGE